MKTRLDLILDRVEAKKIEVTLDFEGASETERSRVIETVRARGLNVSGTWRWILVRDLRGLEEVPPHTKRATGS